MNDTMGECFSFVPRQLVEDVASLRRFSESLDDLLWDETLTAGGDPYVTCFALYCFGARHDPEALAEAIGYRS